MNFILFLTFPLLERDYWFLWIIFEWANEWMENIVNTIRKFHQLNIEFLSPSTCFSDLSSIDLYLCCSLEYFFAFKNMKNVLRRFIFFRNLNLHIKLKCFWNMFAKMKCVIKDYGNILKCPYRIVNYVYPIFRMT